VIVMTYEGRATHFRVMLPSVDVNRRRDGNRQRLSHATTLVWPISTRLQS